MRGQVIGLGGQVLGLGLGGQGLGLGLGLDPSGLGLGLGLGICGLDSKSAFYRSVRGMIDKITGKIQAVVQNEASIFQYYPLFAFLHFFTKLCFEGPFSSFTYVRLRGLGLYCC